MKKIAGMILAAAMICTMAFVITSCGEEDTSSQTSISQTADNTSQTDTPDDNSVFPKALENVQAIPLPDIANTGWQLSGGMVDGKEMEQSDVQAILDACGGRFNFIFPDEGAVVMENGQQSFSGTYEAVADHYIIHAVFEGYEYYAVFTTINEVTVMVLVNTADSETALYLTQVEEG